MGTSFLGSIRVCPRDLDLHITCVRLQCCDHWQRWGRTGNTICWFLRSGHAVHRGRHQYPTGHWEHRRKVSWKTQRLQKREEPLKQPLETPRYAPMAPASRRPVRLPSGMHTIPGQNGRASSRLVQEQDWTQQGTPCVLAESNQKANPDARSGKKMSRRRAKKNKNSRLRAKGTSQRPTASRVQSKWLEPGISIYAEDVPEPPIHLFGPA